MSVILDASAMLALLFDEPGAALVMPHARGSRLLAVNFAEVMERVIRAGGSPAQAERMIDRLEITIVPFDRTLARHAAELRQRTRFMGASLASGLPILSADRDWQKLDLGLDIRMIR